VGDCDLVAFNWEKSLAISFSISWATSLDSSRKNLSIPICEGY